jgi:hypothetical protein
MNISYGPTYLVIKHVTRPSSILKFLCSTTHVAQPQIPHVFVFCWHASHIVFTFWLVCIIFHTLSPSPQLPWNDLFVSWEWPRP